MFNSLRLEESKHIKVHFRKILIIDSNVSDYMRICKQTNRLILTKISYDGYLEYQI